MDSTRTTSARSRSGPEQLTHTLHESRRARSEATFAARSTTQPSYRLSRPLRSCARGRNGRCHPHRMGEGSLVEPDFTFPICRSRFCSRCPAMACISTSRSWRYSVARRCRRLVSNEPRRLHRLWTAVYLMQTSSYNNHYYLLILLCLSALAHAGKRRSVVGCTPPPEDPSDDLSTLVSDDLRRADRDRLLLRRRRQARRRLASGRPMAIWLHDRRDYFSDPFSRWVG